MIDEPDRRVNEIIKGLRGISVDTALHLGTFLCTDARGWTNMQTHHDIENARELMADVLRRFRRHSATDTV